MFSEEEFSEEDSTRLGQLATNLLFQKLSLFFSQFFTWPPNLLTGEGARDGYAYNKLVSSVDAIANSKIWNYHWPTDSLTDRGIASHLKEKGFVESRKLGQVEDAVNGMLAANSWKGSQ